MEEAISYRGYVLQAIPKGSDEETWTAQVMIRRERSEDVLEQKYVAVRLCDTREKAIAASLELGRRVIDGEIEGLTPP